MNYNKLIDYFKVAPTDGTKMDVMDCISKCAQYGFIPQPECCTKEVLDYVKTKDWNPNSTFYKTWKDVTEKSRFELFIDQLMHYASTYGTGYRAEAWKPNDEPIKINYNTYTIIVAVSPRELFDKCMDVLQSGIALSTDMLNACVDYVVECNKKYGYPIDVDSIKNRDAIVMICDRAGIFPTKGQEIVRYLFYKTTGHPMVLQSRRTIDKIKSAVEINGEEIVNLTKLTDQQLFELSKVFYRYKKFLLALRVFKKNRPIINKIRRMAVKNHEPMVKGFWENLTNLSQEDVMKNLDKQIAKLDNPFKITRLIQMLDIRKRQNQLKLDRVFFIRNGRSFTKKEYPGFASWLILVRDKLVERLAEFIAPNVGGRLIKLPENIELACPISDKMFFGNVPFGSFMNFRDKDNFFGVYWRNQWGTRDFDLSFILNSGGKVGWNASYATTGMVFSGDMTNADPEATEMFYIAQRVPDGVIYLNRFNGNPDSKYQLFVGQQHIGKLSRNFMVDPNNVFMRVDGVSTAKQQVVGYVADNTLYFIVSDRGEGIVSSERMTELQTMVQSTLQLREMLTRAGATIWYEGMCNAKGEKIDPDIDLSNFTKDTLLNIFKKEAE